MTPAELKTFEVQVKQFLQHYNKSWDRLYKLNPGASVLNLEDACYDYDDLTSKLKSVLKDLKRMSRMDVRIQKAIRKEAP